MHECYEKEPQLFNKDVHNHTEATFRQISRHSGIDQSFFSKDMIIKMELTLNGNKLLIDDH